MAEIIEERRLTLDALYHSPEGYIGENAFWKLVKSKGIKASRNDIRDFYKTLAEPQRFKTPTTPKNMTHIMANYPNEIHQMDLIEMDRDNGYKYIFAIVDVFSRYASGSAIKTKYSNIINEGLIEAYESDPLLKWPKKIMCDQGKEFNNDAFEKLLKEHGTTLIVNRTTDKRFTGIIERFNKTIETPIFLKQHTKELELMKNRRSNKYKMVSQWVDSLRGFILAYNNRPMRLLSGNGNMSPKDAMQNPEKVVYIYTMKQFSKIPLNMFQPVKIEEFSKSKLSTRHMRETFSNKIYYIRNIIMGNMINPARYVIMNEDGDIMPLTFYREELQLINKPNDNIEVNNLADETGTVSYDNIDNADETGTVSDEDEQDEMEQVIPTITNKRGRKIAKPKRYRD